MIIQDRQRTERVLELCSKYQKKALISKWLRFCVFDGVGIALLSTFSVLLHFCMSLDEDWFSNDIR